MKTTSSTKSNILCTVAETWIAKISLYCHTNIARTSVIILNNRGARGHPCHNPPIERKSQTYCHLKLFSASRLEYICATHTIKKGPKPIHCKTFLRKSYWTLSKAFLASQKYNKSGVFESCA